MARISMRRRGIVQIELGMGSFIHISRKVWGAWECLGEPASGSFAECIGQVVGDETREVSGLVVWCRAK